jgi:hypothetical protein
MAVAIGTQVSRGDGEPRGGTELERLWRPSRAEGVNPGASLGESPRYGARTRSHSSRQGAVV